MLRTIQPLEGGLTFIFILGVVGGKQPTGSGIGLGIDHSAEVDGTRQDHRKSLLDGFLLGEL